MRVLVAALVALSLALAASASPVPYTDCSHGAGHVKIASIDASPYPPVKGEPVAVTVTGQLNENVTAGTYTIDVQLFGITLLSTTGDLCTLDPSKFSCPHAAGPVTLTDSVTVPTIAPSGTYTLTLTMNDQTGAELACVSLQVTIGGNTQASMDTMDINDVEFINYINSVGTTWKAGTHDKWEGMTFADAKGLMGSLPEKVQAKLPVKHHKSNVIKALPENFDSRQQWGSICPSTNDIRDQGACGSCWAFGFVEAATDRVCIHSNGTVTPYLAAEDVLSCCIFSCGSGCNGGYPSAAWSYFKANGVVTGGPYDSNQGCMPYEVAACDHHVNGTLPPCGNIVPTPAYKKQCDNGAVWANDKHFGATAYSISSDVTQIQTEIYTNGPVEAAYTVYADFLTYKTGVYQHVSGEELGGHAVKILGWGVENNTPYWLVANSWNTDWGDAGYFKILRGSDECGIEDGIVAGLPQL